MVIHKGIFTNNQITLLPSYQKKAVSFKFEFEHKGKDFFQLNILIKYLKFVIFKNKFYNF